jgi:hypothetical protein
MVTIMKTPSIRKLIFPLVALPILLACALPVLPTPAAPEPTVNPGVIQTIVVATAGAAQTQTALALPPPNSPTATLPATSPPTETQTVTPTVIFIIPTFTFSPTATSAATATETQSSAGEGCRLVGQSPANDTRYSSRERFDVEWTLRNTGGETWVSSDIDFFHSEGRNMSSTNIVDLPRNVRAGDQVTLGVDMRAPGNAGTYTSTWTLGTRNNPLCTVSITIVVR